MRGLVGPAMGHQLQSDAVTCQLSYYQGWIFTLAGQLCHRNLASDSLKKSRNMAKFPQNRLKMNKIAKFGRQKNRNSCLNRKACNTGNYYFSPVFSFLSLFYFPCICQHSTDLDFSRVSNPSAPFSHPFLHSHLFIF